MITMFAQTIPTENPANVYETIPSDKVPAISRDDMSTSVKTPGGDENNKIDINVSVPDFRMQVCSFMIV